MLVLALLEVYSMFAIVLKKNSQKSFNPKLTHPFPEHTKRVSKTHFERTLNVNNYSVFKFV